MKQSKNENKAYGNLLGIAKAVPTEKFTALQVYIRNQGKSEINNLNSYLNNPEMEQNEPKTSRRK